MRAAQGADPPFLVDDDTSCAHAVPGIRARIVATTAMFAALTAIRRSCGEDTSSKPVHPATCASVRNSITMAPGRAAATGLVIRPSDSDVPEPHCQHAEVGVQRAGRRRVRRPSRHPMT